MQKAAEGANVSMSGGMQAGVSQMNASQVKSQYETLMGTITQQVVAAIREIVAKANLPPEMVEQVIQSLVTGVTSTNMSGIVGQMMNLKPQS
jgi:formylmethanofuran:tetrahydromethanopterin formyltransferase